MSDDLVYNRKFVEVLGKHPCIYDFNRKDHSRRDVVEKAWKAIEAEVKLPAVQCKKKWKNLRTAFSRSTKAPPSRRGAYKKPYYLTDAMQFVLPFVVTKPKRGNSNETPESEVNLPKDYPNAPSTSKSADPPSVDEIGYVQKLVLSPLETEKTTKEPNQNVKKRSSRTTNEADKSSIEYVNSKKSKTTVSENSNPKLDFLRSLLPDLDKMNDYQLRQFKKRTLDSIDLILCDAPQSPQILSKPGSAFSGQSYSTENNTLSQQEMEPQDIYTDIPLQSYLLNFVTQLPDHTTSSEL